MSKKTRRWTVDFRHPFGVPSFHRSSGSEKLAGITLGYGEARNDMAKAHPCLKAWNRIPLEERVKD